MANAWITFVKDYAKKKGLKYNDALKDKGLKSAYEKSKKGGKKEAPPKPGKAPAKRKVKGKKAEEE